MNNYQSLFRSIQLIPQRLLSKINVWETNQVKTDLLMTSLEIEMPEKEVNFIGFSIYKWPEKDLALVYGSFDSGLLFTSIKEAEEIIPFLRSFGFSEEDFFWFLYVDRESVDELLIDSDWKKYPMEERNVFIHKSSGNVLNRMGEGQASWFQKREHFQLFVDFVNEMEATT